MNIDYDGILDNFILIAREALPTQLSMIGENEDIPAVIRARQKGITPDYPYVTLDVLDTREEFGWLNNEHVNDSDQVVVETTKQLLLNYRVYGGSAINLANILHGFFRLNRVLGSIRTTLGGSVVSTSDIDQLPILLADGYLESASFNLVFNITDTFVDTFGSNVFDHVNLYGEIQDEAGNVVAPKISIAVPTI